MAVTKGEREQDPSLLDRLITLGEEAEGVGSSPGVKKPKVNSREEGSWRSKTNRRSFDDGLASIRQSRIEGLVSFCHRRCRLLTFGEASRRGRLLTFGEEAFGCHQRRKGSGLVSSPKGRRGRGGSFSF